MNSFWKSIQSSQLSSHWSSNSEILRFIKPDFKTVLIKAQPKSVLKFWSIKHSEAHILTKFFKKWAIYTSKLHLAKFQGSPDLHLEAQKEEKKKKCKKKKKSQKRLCIKPLSLPHLGSAPLRSMPTGLTAMWKRWPEPGMMGQQGWNRKTHIRPQ